MKKLISVFLSILILMTALTSCFGSGSDSNALSLNAKALTLKIGEKKVMTASVNGEAVKDASVLKWTSANTDIAKVSAAGEVEAVGKGKTVVTVKDEDGGAIASCTVTVDAGSTDITDITIESSNLSLEVGATATPKYSVKPAQADTSSLIWKSSNTAVATVKDGTVTAISKGTAVIMVSNADETVSAALILNVAENGSSTGTMLLDKNEVNLISSSTISSSSYAILTPSFSPAELSDDDIVWISSNESAAKVSSKGVVVAVGAGMAVITATSKKYDLSAVCTVNVSTQEVAVSSIAVYPSTMTLEVGSSNSAAVFIYPTNATNQSVLWSSSNILVATVDASTGTITGISEGYAVITATTADGLKTASCTVTVSGSAAGTSGAITFDKTSIELTTGKQGILTVSPAGVKVVWKSSNVNIVAVDSAGILTATGAGQATVTATTEDGKSTATCIVNVTAATSPTLPHVAATKISLNQTNRTLKEGESFTLGATVLPSNATYQTLAFNADNGNVVEVDVMTGKVTAIKEGTAVITVTNGEISATCKVTVEKAGTQKITSITLDGIDGTEITVGSSATVNATINPSDFTEHYTWSIDRPDLATFITGTTSCTVNGIAEGTVTVTITSDSGVSASRTFVIRA